MAYCKSRKLFVATPEITILTASLGRPSLIGVRNDIEAQTVKDRLKWRIIFDGKAARDAGMPQVENLNVTNDIIVATTSKSIGHFGLLWSVIDSVNTPYICIMDDDNRFAPDHVERLLEGLKTSQFCATSRYYTDEMGLIIAKESPESELVDSNCMGIRTNYFKQVRQFWRDNGESTNFIDIQFNLCSLLFGVKPVRLKDAYTVFYKVNPLRTPPEEYRTEGTEMIFETLSGTFFKVDYGKKL